MWALNLKQLFANYRDYYKFWQPAKYMEAVWGFYDNLESAPKEYAELLTGTESELREMLAIKYAVNESSSCTRINSGKDGEVYIPGHGDTKGCYVSQYPIYTGTSWDEALEIVTRIPKILVPESLVTAEYSPDKGLCVFNGAYGSERSRAFPFVFLWHNPTRALRLLTNKAKREAGLLKPRKPSMDYYRLLMECLKSVVYEHTDAFKYPRGLPHTLKFERLHVTIVAKRAQYKDDPCEVMQWIKGCHLVYRLMDRKAFQRLGTVRHNDWNKPEKTYRQAISILIRDEARMKDCVRRYFKIRYKMWNWCFAWIRTEEKRLARRRAGTELKKLAA